MSSDNKLKLKGKSRTHKKKQNILKKADARKISEKYLDEELQVENTIKLRNVTKPADEDYAKRRQTEVDFFCDPFSSVRLDLERPTRNDVDVEKNANEDEPDVDEVSQKSEPHSVRSNESNTHLASTYIGLENDDVINKFELTRITYDELQLLYYPKSDDLRAAVADEEKALRVQSDEGFYVPPQPTTVSRSNKLLLLDRLQENGSTEFFNRSGDLKNFQKLFSDDVFRLTCDRKFTPIYVPPTPMTFEPIDKIINDKKFIKIYISQLTFDQHRLFTNEHHIAKLVEKLFGE